jgi:hypothetical protein
LKKRTKSDAEIRTSSVQIILQLVVEDTENGDEKVKEEPNSEEELAATFIDQPVVELLLERFGLVRFLGAGSGQRTLKALKSTALRFVALEVGRAGIALGGKVGVKVSIRCAVSEIHGWLLQKSRTSGVKETKECRPA